MGQPTQVHYQSPLLTLAPSGQPGHYVYCLAPASEQLSLGNIGIESREVYTIAHKDICALVYDCSAELYQPGNAEAAAAWVLAHHQVVDAAWRQWGTVLPVTFNTIMAAGEKSTEENLLAWLGTEYEPLKRRLDALKGKAEYGVQVSWDPVLIGQQVANSSPEIRRLEEEVRNKPRGLEHMYRRRLELVLRRETQARLMVELKGLYASLSRHVSNIHMERSKKNQTGRQTLVNITCLVSPDKAEVLEAELERMVGREEYSVRVSGPLPPYSFC